VAAVYRNIIKLICDGPVIPAVRNQEDFSYALAHVSSPSIILLFGDIFTLPGLLEKAKQANKLLIVHIDLIEGIGKDKIGVKYLALSGVRAIITTKPYLGRIAREEKMIVIQRLFLMDSEALRTGIHLLSTFRPDAIEVLPGTVPVTAVSELTRVSGLPILAGGLISTAEDVKRAIGNGIRAISTSKRELWRLIS
jgi:glycerol uptake operon antiterminator